MRFHNSTTRLESGFTITEIMAAAAILTIGILGVLIVFNSSLNTQSNTKVKTLATNIATEKIETARNVSYANLTEPYLQANLGTTANRSGLNFTIAYSIVYVDDPSDGTGASDLDPKDFKDVKVTVSWTTPKPASSVLMETLVNSNPVEPISASTDVTAPAWPNAGVGVLSGHAEQSSPGLGLYIQWSPNWATDANGVVGYLIYRQPPGDTNFLLVSTVAPSVGWFLDTYYSGGGTYNYYVKGFDGAGNISGASNTVTIVAPADTTPPSVPTGLNGSNTAPGVIHLTWTPSTDNSGVVDHYRVWRWSPDRDLGTVTTTTFDDTTATRGSWYWYKVNACDPSGNVSAWSYWINVYLN